MDLTGSQGGFAPLDFYFAPPWINHPLEGSYSQRIYKKRTYQKLHLYMHSVSLNCTLSEETEGK